MYLTIFYILVSPNLFEFLIFIIDNDRNLFQPIFFNQNSVLLVYFW